MVFALVLRFLLNRSKFKRVMDGYCGFCILGLYFLYLTVVKGALSVFDCSVNQDGVYILDADPSIKCNEVRHLHCPASYNAACRLLPVSLLSVSLRSYTSRCCWRWMACVLPQILPCA
jgi:hypothetical protein